MRSFDGSGNVTYVNIGVDQEPFSLSNFAFNGQWNDVVSNLYYLRNRYYDCFQGRFITNDSLGIWSDDNNLGCGKTYCGNAPVHGMDPLGLMSEVTVAQNMDVAKRHIRGEDIVGAENLDDLLAQLKTAKNGDPCLKRIKFIGHG